MNGREVIGSCVPEMLVADADFPMSVVSVTIAATADGEISLKRGSVLAADDTDGTCSLSPERLRSHGCFSLYHGELSIARGDGQYF